jgi:formiminoglutamase
VPLRENFYTKYIIPFDTPHLDLVFYKSLLSERWWLEIPEPPSYALEIAQGIPNFYKRATLVPCSPQDYQETTQGNLPDRLIKALARG